MNAAARIPLWLVVLAATCLAAPVAADQDSDGQARHEPAVGQHRDEGRTQVVGARYFYYCRPGSAIKYRIALPADAEAGEARIAGVQPAPNRGVCHL